MVEVRTPGWPIDSIIVSLGSMALTTTFVRHPGLSGPFGALMDEYARAAEDFCRVVESFDLARFDAERPSNNPNTVSPRAICLHVNWRSASICALHPQGARRRFRRAIRS
jgi:hypothetical protein